MSRPKILVLDDFSDDFFRKVARYGEVTRATDLTEDIHLGDVAILVIRSKTKVNKKHVDRMRNLKCVISATHGINHVCTDYLGEKGVEFHNVPVQSYDIAQGVMAYIFAFSTNLIEANNSIKRWEWQKKRLRGFRVKGKTLGVVGYGRIGKEVARMASACGMNVIICDPYVKADVPRVTLDKLLKRSDIITIHVPLTEETRGMIGRKEIRKMKKGAYLINTAKGEIINEDGLSDALKEGKLGGAALDVFQQEPPFTDEVSKTLIMHEKVMATPHSIGQTVEALEEKGNGVIRIIMDFCSIWNTK